jgi:hypothetical protein
MRNQPKSMTPSRPGRALSRSSIPFGPKYSVVWSVPRPRAKTTASVRVAAAGPAALSVDVLPKSVVSPLGRNAVRK